MFFISKSKHRQSAYGWNPPPLPRDAKLPFDAPQNVVSATECTGLTQQPLIDENACTNIQDLYATLPLKPQGNVGKGNPRNDKSEIEFHRGHEKD